MLGRTSFVQKLGHWTGPASAQSTAYCKKVETSVSSRADLSKPRKQVVARPAAALWRAASPGAGGTGRSAARQAPGERRPSVAARSRCAHVA